MGLGSPLVFGPTWPFPGPGFFLIPLLFSREGFFWLIDRIGFFSPFLEDEINAPCQFGLKRGLMAALGRGLGLEVGLGRRAFGEILGWGKFFGRGCFELFGRSLANRAI
jgi:hypothetical protein